LLNKANILISGHPGCGKSTLVNRLVETARKKHIKVGGISTPEFRLPTGKRGGFLIQNLATGMEQIMASVDQSSPISVGRYGVNLDAIRNLGVTAINQAVSEADLVVIDEIGKMEIAAPDFLTSVIKALDSSVPVLGTIGLWLKTPRIVELKNRKDITLKILTPETRNQLYQSIMGLLGL
jgi:nucleoside-triphosphatase